MHRLILNISDGGPSTTLVPQTRSFSEPSTENHGFVKIIEVEDRFNPSSIRPSVPPLSSQQEEIIINRMLEEAAHHYNQV